MVQPILDGITPLATDVPLVATGVIAVGAVGFGIRKLWGFGRSLLKL